MEQGPRQLYERTTSGELSPMASAQEKLLPKIEVRQDKPEVKPSSEEFEKLVKAALDEELKFERDPKLRDEAAQRADQILAEFAEVKGQGNSAAEPASDQLPEAPVRKTSEDIAKDLGVDDAVLRRPTMPRAPRVSYGPIDVIMMLVIAALLLIVILILVL